MSSISCNLDASHFELTSKQDSNNNEKRFQPKKTRIAVETTWSLEACDHQFQNKQSEVKKDESDAVTTKDNRLTNSQPLASSLKVDSQIGMQILIMTKS